MAIPHVTVFNPVANIGPQVPVRFVVENADNQPVDVTAEYSFNGSAYKPATPAISSDGLSNLPAPFIGADYRFIWNALIDLTGSTGSTPVTGTARIRLTASRGGMAGSPAETGVFAVQTAPGKPPAPPPTKVPVEVGTLEIVSGRDQTGITGQLLPESLQVRVRDAQGNPIVGARVSFNVVVPSGSLALVDIEDDLVYRTTTSSISGFAAVRVRARTRIAPPSAGVSGIVEARVVGDPDPAHVARFRFTLYQPEIGISPDPRLTGSQFMYGRSYEFRLGLVGNANDVNTLEYAPDCSKPVRFALAGSNVILSHREIISPDQLNAGSASVLGGAAPVTIWVILVDPTGAGEIRITCPSDPTINPQIIPLPSDPDFGPQRAVGQLNGFLNYAMAPVYLHPVSGLGPAGSTPPVAYPGMTLTEAFKIIITDGTRDYGEEVAANWRGCGVLPVKLPMSLDWTASDGTLSTNQGPGASNHISADINTLVYFTPAGPGPWFITVSKSGTNPVFDAGNVGQIILTDQSGHVTGCAHEHVFEGGGSPGAFTFVVQAPSEAHFVDAGSGNPLTTMRAGDRVKLRVSGLSQLSGNPAPVKLTSLLAGDVLSSTSALPQYSGLTYHLEQGISVHAIPSTATLETDEILIVQGDPTISVTAPVIHSVIPGGLLRVQGDALAFSLAVQRWERRRLISAGVESIQETPVGTTPTGGAAGTVVMRNGEFVYGGCDITVPTRAGAITFCRNYRSHLLSDGPLGPGWSCEHFGYLDVQSTVRWCGGSGRYDDFDANDKPPKGLFVALTRNTAIDKDHSAVEIMDAYRNVMHFNIDGSLRFVKDRRGDVTSYTYNELGQLVTLLGPHKWGLTLDYWPIDRANPSKKDGKLMRVTDTAGRMVDFRYYPDSDAAAGWLWTVTWPAADTLLSGQNPGDVPTPSYRRSETYTYEVDQQNRLKGRLLSVVDSEGRNWVVNRYDGESRVYEQDHGNGTFAFQYDTGSPVTTIAKDRRKIETTWTFPASPFSDAAAPDTYLEHAGAEDAFHEFEHNADGSLIHYKLGARGIGALTVSPREQAFFSYDDQALEDRQHGNLLAVRRKALSGEERVWSFEYTTSAFAPHDFNLLLRAVGPRGNARGVNSEIYATHYTYDHQVTPAMAAADPDLARGGQGNLVRVTLPRALHMVVGQGASGNHEQFWIDDNVRHTFKYNSYGLMNWYRDPQGVVTEFSYYPEGTPTGGTATPMQGGFLALSERDTTVTAVRDLYLPGAPPDRQVFRWSYDQLGHVNQFVDNGGNTTTFETNSLHQTVKATRAAGASGSAQPATIETRYAYNSLGIPVQTKLNQLGAGADQGGDFPFDEVRTDALGNVGETYSTLAAGAAVATRLERDENDELTAWYPEDALPRPGRPASYPSCGAGMDLDARGLPVALKQGISQASGLGTPLLTSRCDWATNGMLAKFTAAGAQQPFEYHQDAYGDPFGVVDPRGNVVHSLSDDAGRGTRSAAQQGEGAANETARLVAPSPTDAPVLSFSETRLDELGRPRRTHAGMFSPIQTATGGGAIAAAPGVPEYFPPNPAFPPQVGQLLMDGKWGPGDGRTTTDLTLDAWNLPSRFVDDELGFLYVRRDAHGRPYQTSAWGGDDASKPAVMRLVGYAYNTAGDVESMEVTDNSTDLAQPSRTCPLKLDRDDLGRVVRVIDGEGNAHRIEHDQMGFVYASYDAMGSDSTEVYNGHPVNHNGNKTTFTRDGLGRTTKIETELSVDGRGGSPRDTTNPFNPQGTVSIELTYTDSGRLLSHRDHAGYETTWSYDTYGRPQAVNYADAPALGGPTTVTVEYDPATGLPSKTTDANMTIVAYGYDGLHRLTRVEVATTGFSGSRGYQLDHMGSRSVTIELDPTSGAPTGRAVELVRDSAGRVQSEIQGGIKVESQHDGNGNRTLLKYPDNHGNVEYTYDSAGRLRKIVDRGQEVARFEYIGPHRLTSRVQNGITSSFTFSDGSGRFVGMRVDGVGAAAGATEYSLERDRMSRLTRCRRTESGSDEIKTWTYDSAGRIVSQVFTLTPPSSRAPASLKTERLYDGDTVLRQETRDTVSGGAISQIVVKQEREERGRITSRAGVPLKYDRNGNLIDDGTQQYVYDAFSRLVQVGKVGQTIASYAYDGLNRLASRTTASITEQFIYSGWQLLEVHITPTAGASSLERYVYSDQLDDIVSIEMAGRRYMLLYNPAGYVEALVDDQRNIVERYEYDLDGQVTVLDPSGAVVANATPRSRFLFQCRPYEPDTGLYYYRMRWYAPRLGAFLTPDPSGFADGANEYGLNHGDSLNFTDRIGLDDQPAQPAEKPPNNKEVAKEWLLFGVHHGTPILNAPDRGLLARGYAAAGENAVGFVAVPKVEWTWKMIFRPGTLFKNPFQAWGHLAGYSRVGGEITTVRGFDPSISELIGDVQGEVKAGTRAVAGQVVNDARMLLDPHARIMEFSQRSRSVQLTESEARAFSQDLTRPSSTRYTARPAKFRSIAGNASADVANCDLWAIRKIESFLGRKIGPYLSRSILDIGPDSAVLEDSAHHPTVLEFMTKSNSSQGVASSGMPTFLKAAKYIGAGLVLVGTGVNTFDALTAEGPHKYQTQLGALGEAIGTFGGIRTGFIGGLTLPGLGRFLGEYAGRLLDPWPRLAPDASQTLTNFPALAPRTGANDIAHDVPRLR